LDACPSTEVKVSGSNLGTSNEKCSYYFLLQQCIKPFHSSIVGLGLFIIVEPKYEPYEINTIVGIQVYMLIFACSLAGLRKLHRQVSNQE
jgi:hypothetical protein